MGLDDHAPLRGPTGRLTLARRILHDAERVLVLTGAGISAESGVPTFRDSMDGYWRQFRPEDLATPEAFARDPVQVWAWYESRRARLRECGPNRAHHALARWILEAPDSRRLYTQNVDGLHRRALTAAHEGGAPPHEALPRELHGDIFVIRCSVCSWSERNDTPVDASSIETLPHCAECDALARPAVVWFGEALDGRLLRQAMADADRATVCLSVGTSALVHPAASLPRIVLAAGGELIEVNPEPTPLSADASIRISGAAGSVLPELLD
jgi:NAD-dependent deacetylase